jgi:hypothetical protein
MVIYRECRPRQFSNECIPFTWIHFQFLLQHGRSWEIPPICMWKKPSELKINNFSQTHQRSDITRRLQTALGEAERHRIAAYLKTAT